MRGQRPAHLPDAVDAYAEHLPFADKAFDAALATITVHQWADLTAGLAEARRVTRGPIVVLSCDPTELAKFWLDDYAPEVLATEAVRYPSIDRLTALLGARTTVTNVPIPLNCSDGFGEAYYGRPEALLDPGARKANSAWSFVTEDIHAPLRTVTGSRSRFRRMGRQARPSSAAAHLRRIAETHRQSRLTLRSSMRGI